MRINFFAGPGTGKSTTAAWIFAELKKRGVSVEYVTEYVKAWAYQKREVKQFDQVYLFAKQHHAEYQFLSHGVDHIVTDSPTFQSVIYAQKFTPELAPALAQMCEVYDQSYPSLNIFLTRGEKPYSQQGRYQTEDQAREWDAIILDALTAQYGDLGVNVLSVADQTGILDLVLDRTRRDALDRLTADAQAMGLGY